VKKTRKEYRAELDEILGESLADDPTESYTPITNELYSAFTELGVKREKTELPRWDYLNNFIGGFSPHEFTILCGPTGVGKTVLLSSWTLALITGSIPTFVASVEIGKQQFVNKLISGVLGRNLDLIMPEEVEGIKKQVLALIGSTSTVLSDYGSRIDHMELMTDILCAHRELGTRVALLDNLNFMMEVKKSQDQLVSMDKTIHDFVIFCKKIPIHILMVMHPKKTEGGRVSSEFDIKGSSTAVQEATNVLLYNRLANLMDAPSGVNAKTCRELKIAKSRFYGRNAGRKIFLGMHQSAELLKEVGVDNEG
jgi:hypothetical protein